MSDQAEKSDLMPEPYDRHERRLLELVAELDHTNDLTEVRYYLISLGARIRREILAGNRIFIQSPDEKIAELMYDQTHRIMPK